jgi:putative transposase
VARPPVLLWQNPWVRFSVTMGELHHRRSLRLRGYDYASPGAYFVTVCARDRSCLFGEVLNGAMICNALGGVVADAWDALTDHYPRLTLDAFVVMPNHVHGIMIIRQATRPDRRGDACVAPTTADANPRPAGPARGSVGAIVGSLKSAAAQHINGLRGTPGARIWQRGYYERIIRNEGELNRIRQYVAGNPRHWPEDAENPG